VVDTDRDRLNRRVRDVGHRGHDEQTTDQRD
jgi:hypothetical protein